MIDVVQIPGSISYCKYLSKMKHKWKYTDQISIYDIKNVKISLRFSTTAMYKLLKVGKENSRVNTNFIKENNKWIVRIHRSSIDRGRVSQLPLYSQRTSRSRVQIAINGTIPLEIRRYFEDVLADKGLSAGATLPVTVRFKLSEWQDADIRPWDFLDSQDIHARSLMKSAIERGFKVYDIPKGRFYDLQLIGKDRTFAIAIFMHNTDNKARAKYKRVSKLLADIAKMLPRLYSDPQLVPVVVSQPIEGYWSVSTDDYLDFYKNKFGFNYIFTDFKERWAEEVCDELEKIDKRQAFKSDAAEVINGKQLA